MGSRKQAGQVLAHPVQVYTEELGHTQLQAGEPVPDWAEGLIDNPKAFEEVVEDDDEGAVNFEKDFGSGPFTGRKRDQLLALAQQFRIPVDADKNGDTKAEIIDKLEAEGIEPSTVPDEG